MGNGSGAQLQLLRLFELHVDGKRVELPLQAQRVLGYLAVVQRAQSRSALAGCLWGDVAQDRALATLRNALWQLRRASPALVNSSRDVVSINDSVAVDVWAARRVATALTSGSPADVRDGAQLIDLLTGDLVSWDDDWLRLERERLRQLRIHALESLSEVLVHEGRHAEAVQAALAAVGAEPLRESAQAALIRAFLSEGNTSEALRQYHAFRRLLEAELGVRPSPRVESLVSVPLQRAPQPGT